MIAASFHKSISEEKILEISKKMFLGGELGIEPDNIPLLFISLGLGLKIEKLPANDQIANIYNEELAWNALDAGNKILMIQTFSSSRNHARVIYHMQRLGTKTATYMADPWDGINRVFPYDFFAKSPVLMFKIGL